MNDPAILAKVISDLPMNKDLGDKLAVICPYMVKNAVLELQMTSKITWYSANIDKGRALELQKMVNDALAVKINDVDSLTALSL